ncbi:hypothetical protein [Streptomyces tubercidicus]|uniref:hypothetical protein n=1 Tax=Streptomyces tubercidicus TaxID=47759 RepID=UPI003464FA2B
MANPASPPDTPSHRLLAAPEGTAPFSVRHIGPDAGELSEMLSPLGPGYHGMIPLGSCTMKLNATTEMAPFTRPRFAQLRPSSTRRCRDLVCSCPSVDADES